MKKESLFFQVKDLEKLILRNIRTPDIQEVEISNLSPTPTQMQVVGYILDNIDKDIYQKDLERVLNLRRATISGVLQAMEKRGLIERIVDENDTRTKKIVLNHTAKEMFYKGDKILKELEEIAIKDIPQEELEIFLKVIKKMKKNVEENTLL